jgi:hypothetical protein
MPTLPTPPALSAACALVLAAGLSFMASLPAHAQAAAQAATKPVAKPAAKPTTKPVARPAVVPVVVPDEPLTAEELDLANGVHVGDLSCELGQNVKLHADPSNPGHFHLHTPEHRFRMRPVRTSTGALRLEDRQQGAVWIQLANKSMLMSQKLGRRLADECAGPVQRAVAEAMKLNPPPHLLDLGLNR